MPDLARCEGKVPEEIAMGAAGAIERRPYRRLQEQFRAHRIEPVEQCPMMQDRLARPPLRAAGDLSAAEGEIGQSLAAQLPQAERAADPIRNPAHAVLDIAQFGAPCQGNHQRVVQTTRTQEHRASTRAAPQQWNAGPLDFIEMNVALRLAGLAQNDAFMRAFPQPQDRLAVREEVQVHAEVLLGSFGSIVRPGEPKWHFRRALANDTYAIMGHATRMAVYLDCAATTPIDPRVRDEVLFYLEQEFGNSGSRTHEYGRRARNAVEGARDRIAAVVAASRGDVFFTSGATESNNLAILGLDRQDRRHAITTRIEHHAVLEPMAELERRGFDVTYLSPEPGGWIAPEAVTEALRPDTLLVSVMHANNETGVLQPVAEIADAMGDHPAFFHVDAAQGFGKDIAALQHPRIEMISVSGHKIHAPKGVGALILRRRNGQRPPLQPLLFGGGQERGLRPGTLPVPLIAGFGKAAELALTEWEGRDQCCRAFRERLLEGLAPLRPILHGDPDRSLPHIVNLSIPGVDAETAIEAWSDRAAVSDGAACTSASYTCSYVLSAMGLPEAQMAGALRLSWCHFSGMPDVKAMVDAIRP